MTKYEIAHHFKRSFYEASGYIGVEVYSNAIRWLAIVLVILAVMWSINHFMQFETKANDAYLIDFGARLVKLVVALMLFILLLTTQGKI